VIDRELFVGLAVLAEELGYDRVDIFDSAAGSAVVDTLPGGAEWRTALGSLTPGR